MITHASLKSRTTCYNGLGMSGHPEGHPLSHNLGNDAAGTLDDGTPEVNIYPMMGSE